MLLSLSWVEKVQRRATRLMNVIKIDENWGLLH